MQRFAFQMTRCQMGSVWGKEIWCLTNHMQWAGWDSYGAMMQRNSDQRDGLMRRAFFAQKALSNSLHFRLDFTFHYFMHASNSPSPHISLLFCSTLLHGKCIKEKTFFKFSNSYPCPKRDMTNITKFMLMKKAKISFFWLTGRPENLFGKGVCL